MYSIKQAAAALGLSPGTVYGLCAARRIRHERYGLGRGRIKIPEDALQEYRQRSTIEVVQVAASVPPPPAPTITPKHLRLPS